MCGEEEGGDSASIVELSEFVVAVVLLDSLFGIWSWQYRRSTTEYALLRETRLERA